MRRFVFLGLAVLIGLAVLSASLHPRITPGEADKFLHFSVYALWAYVAVQIFQVGWARLGVLCVLIAFGALIEVLQPGFGREASFEDAAANCLGIATGAAAFFLWHGVAVSAPWRLAGFAVGGVLSGAYALAPLFAASSLESWDCDQAFVVGDEIGGGRSWQGELVCARLYTGGPGLKPGTSDVPSCGTGLVHPQATAVLEFGSGSPFGTPDRQNPRRDPQTRAFCKAAKAAHSLVIEAWVRPGAREQGGPARILTFSKSYWERNLTVAQLGSRYDVRLRTSGTGENGSAVPIRTSADAVVPGVLQHIVVWYRDPVVELFLAGGPETGEIRISRSGLAVLKRIASAMALLGGAFLVLMCLSGGVLRLVRLIRPANAP